MQSNAARGLVALAGIAVIVIAFFVISGSDDSDDGGSDAATTAATTTTEANGDEKPAEDKPAEPEVPTLAVVGGQPADGASELTYSQGDRVRFEIGSDTEAEFHLHGYDIEEAATPGKPAKFDFTADIEGKFELEDHHSGALIAELTVNP
jgi:hypothetical protein